MGNDCVYSAVFFSVYRFVFYFRDISTKKPYYWAFLTVSCARPFRLRARRIFLPAVVALRTKKPCVVARLRFFGWYVRFGIRKIYYQSTIQEKRILSRAENYIDRPGLKINSLVWGDVLSDYLTYRSWIYLEGRGSAHVHSSVCV